MGGVLVDLDAQRSFDQLTNLLGQDLSNQKKMYQILDDYEVGAFSEGSFLHRLQRLTSGIVTERQLVDAWNAMLGPLNKKRFQMITSLKKKYHLYLLSNTNHTHLQYFHKYLKETQFIENFEERYFAKAYYSHQIRLSKPDPKVYEYVIKDAQIRPEESLFIDDTIANVESAKEVGLKAVHHNPTNEITEMINVYIEEQNDLA